MTKGRSASSRASRKKRVRRKHPAAIGGDPDFPIKHDSSNTHYISFEDLIQKGFSPNPSQLLETEGKGSVRVLVLSDKTAVQADNTSQSSIASFSLAEVVATIGKHQPGERALRGNRCVHASQWGRQMHDLLSSHHQEI